MVSNAGRTIPKALKIVSVASSLGAQHYKAILSLLLTNLYRTTNIANPQQKKEKSDTNKCLWSSNEHMEDWQSY